MKGMKSYLLSLCYFLVLIIYIKAKEMWNLIINSPNENLVFDKITVIFNNSNFFMKYSINFDNNENYICWTRSLSKLGTPPLCSKVDTPFGAI